MSFKKSADVILILDTSPSTEEPRRQTMEPSETSEKPLKITGEPSTTTEEPLKTTAESQKSTQEPPKTTEDLPKTAKESPIEILIPRKHECLESPRNRTRNILADRYVPYHEYSNTSVKVDEDLLVDRLFSSSWAETKCLYLRKQIKRIYIENMDAFESNDRWLWDIKLGKILAERILVDCQSFNPKGINLTFLWSTFVKRDDLLEPLYKMNADIHSTVPQLGYNALHLAAFTGHVKACEWLISKGLDHNLTVDGVSPLHCAVLGNSLDCTKSLLSQKAVLDDTVLNWAFHANAKELLPYLLNKYVEITIVDENNLTAPHLTANRRIKKCVQIMKSYYQKADLKTITPLHLAAGNNLPECCQFLIDDRANKHAVYNKGWTALHFAARAKSVECLKILLKAGCKVNAAAKDGRTPLHMLFPTNVPAINALEVLLKAGADVNGSDNLGFTSLHLAAEINVGSNDSPQCVDRLIMSGADVTARTNAGLSALSVISKSCPGSINTICRKLDSMVELASFSELSKERGKLCFNFSYFNCNPTLGFVSFLKTLESEGQEQLLEHPVCQVYLLLLWRKIQKFYFGRLFIWLVFVILLTAYVIYALAQDCYNAAFLTHACESCLNYITIWNDASKNISTEEHEIFLESFANLKNSSKYNLTASLEMCLNNFTEVNNATVNISTEACKMCLNDFIIGSFLIERPHLMKFIWNVLVTMAILESTRKIWIILHTRSKVHYFFQLENIFEWFVILSVFLVWSYWYGQILDWQKTIGGIAVLFGWADFMLLIGQLPIFGIYVAMFTRVQTEFFKLLLVYSCLLIGFTCSFCVFFPSDKTFQNPLIGFVKILAMMTGELDFGILKTNLNSETSPVLNFSAYMTYAFFLIFVTVVLMTLLTGIAVHDIQGLRRTANVSKLTRQTELINSVERTITRSYLLNKIDRFMWKKDIFLEDLVWGRVDIKPVYYPYHPGKHGLPKEVLMAALNVAKQKEKWNGSTGCWLDTLKDHADTVPNQDEKNVYEELRQIKDTVSKLMKNNSNNLSEERFLNLEKNLYKELRQLKGMVEAQNGVPLQRRKPLY